MQLHVQMYLNLRIQDLLEAVVAGGPKAETEEAEPEPPAPFEYVE